MIISSDINKAASFLQENEVVAIPTETVYGLAGNIYSEAAIKKIFEVKKRPLFNPLIVHVHALEEVEKITREFPPKARTLANHFWPGALTLVLKKKDLVPDLITAGKDTVAVRIPNHPITLELLKILPFPLAAPSANPFNRISPTKSSHVANYFNNEIPMVLEGGSCKRGLESTIVGFENGEPIIYRFGSTSQEDIEKLIGEVRVMNKKENAPLAPGMLAKHYSPQTKTYITDDVEAFLKDKGDKKVAVLSFKNIFDKLHVYHVETLSSKGDLKEAASKLYNALHKLDQLDVDMIVAERFPSRDLGKSINDRLERAAK